ncbi:lysophospholipid acyltransferase family protein [bacterium]|nr:lysophospholipid acyltransferase family protein [candidate division CSSED10-310 bacterium]
MTPVESLGRDLARLIIWYPFRYLVGILPASLSIAIFRLMGLLHWYAGGRDRIESAMAVLPVDILPEEQRTGAARRYYMNHYVDRLQIFLFPRWRRPAAAARFMRTQGLEHLRSALAAGRGAIIVHPHFGPIQMKLFPLAAAGFRLLQIGYPSAANLSAVGRLVAFRLRVQLEDLLPAVIHPADRFMRPVLRHLGENNVVLVTGDGAGGGVKLGAGRELPFLDAAMVFPEGPFNLSQLTGAPLLPAFIVSERNGYWKLVIGRPFEAITDEASQAAAMARFARYLERFIFRYPELWHFWDEWESGKRKCGAGGRRILNEIAMGRETLQD